MMPRWPRLVSIVIYYHRTRTYEVAEPGGTNEAGEIRDRRKHTMVITSKTCTCRRPQQFHFPCSHMVAACRARNVSVDSMIPHDLSVQALLDTWSPRFVPFRDESEWPSYDGPKYVVDPETKWPNKGTRKRTQYKMEMDRIHGRLVGEMVIPLLPTPWRHAAADVWELATMLGLVNVVRSHVITYVTSFHYLNLIIFCIIYIFIGFYMSNSFFNMYAGWRGRGGTDCWTSSTTRTTVLGR
jgi:hypothetical protein